MAERPIFFASNNPDILFTTKNFHFKYAPGFSITQKRKNILRLHNEAALSGTNRVLEISTKSTEEIGRNLSAFNLKVKMVDSNNRRLPLESVYQGSKVFQYGGPYTDLYYETPKKIKKDPRLKESGKIISFKFNNKLWATQPLTAFYDWLYINAVILNNRLIKELLTYDAFSDIEFNPQKSINCQARSAAIFVSLYRNNVIEKVLNNKSIFIEKLKYTYNSSKHDLNDNSLFNLMYSKKN